MPGYRADPDAIGAAAGVLRETVDSVAAARDQLDADVCAGIGPGRLAAVAARLTGESRRDLDNVLRAIVENAELALATARRYTEDDEASADLFRRAEPS
jgi:hypothetical protein